MNAFLRKLKLSFLAMLCGWIACNITLWVGFLLDAQFMGLAWRSLIAWVAIYAAGSGIVVLAAWLVIFLPVDLIISDQSELRMPFPASVCGFIAGSCTIVLAWVLSTWRGDPINASVDGYHWKTLPYLMSPGITGMVAAYVRSRGRELSLKKA